MELRHFRYFVAVAEELNFTRAALRLGIGQPPLSQQIKDLEAELGVMLFRRVPHGAELTEAGKVFLHEGRRVLAGADFAVNAVKRTARGESGRLRLGFTGSAHLNAYVPGIIRAFGSRYPDIELQLEEAHSFKLLDRLQLGEIDVAFTHSDPKNCTALNALSVDVEPLVAVLPSVHRCSGCTTVRLSMLASDYFIMKPPEVGPELYRTIIEACRSAGFEPLLGQATPQISTVVSLVAAGLGVSLVPSSVQQMKAPGVVYLPLDEIKAEVFLSLVWRRNDRSAVITNFTSLAKEMTHAITA